MDKTLIYTTLFIDDQKYAELFYDWVFSIRTLGEYKGDILVGDYGIKKEFIDRFKNYNINFVKLPDRGKYTISNYRNIDMIPILEKYDIDYKFAHFDVDIWFQNSINPLFEKLDNIESCYFGIEQGRMCRWRGPNEQIEIDKYNTIQQKLNGFVFGGWIAGRYKPFLEKLKLMRDTFNSPGWNLDEWGTDQCMVTYLFDFNKDDSTGDKWGKSYYFCDFIDNKWKIQDELSKRYNISDDVTGVHLVTFEKENEDRRFKQSHPKLFEQEWKKIE